MEEKWIVMYDGYCNLCSRTVQWIIRNDRKKRFTFEPLKQQNHVLPPPDLQNSPIQNPYTQESPTRNSPIQGDTLILSLDEKIYVRSAAVLKIAARLRFPWPLLGVFLVVPRFVRDLLYKVVARNRRRWFGERSTCYIPDVF